MREIKLVEDIKRITPPAGKRVKQGIGDDCAVLEYNRHEYMLISTDMLVEGTHFLLNKKSLADIGRKAVSVNVSDIIAMGGLPANITVSLGVPGDMASCDIKKIYKGILDRSSEYCVTVIGGDINRSERLVVSITIIGYVRKKYLITRKGAKPGDVIVMTGPVRDSKKRGLRITPRYRAARSIIDKFSIHAMIDVSDGVGPDLTRLCDVNNVNAAIYQDQIILEKGLTLEDALYYGESYELLMTMTKRESDRMINTVNRKKGISLMRIGEIRGKTRKGNVLVCDNGDVVRLASKGFQHLS